KYSKAGHSYHLVNPGQLDKKTLRRMNEALAQNAELKTGESTGKVVLDKDKKRAVSLSLRVRFLGRFGRVAALSGSWCG
ncbi:tellurium resistance protein TerW, partial [Escherichia coli]|nr:tellurium resistance protein TerW [Escherichia coli]